MQIDGKVIIGTTVDTKEFYKKIKEFDKINVPNIEIEPEVDIKTLEKEIFKGVKEINKYADLEIISEEDLTQIQKYIEFINKANERIEELGGQKIVINGLNDTEDLLEQVEETAKKIDLSNVQKKIDGIGTSLQKIGKKIGRWALAVFGISGAFNFIKSSMSIIAQQDEQLASDIQYMRNALAYSMEPIVRIIVGLMKNLLYFVGAIIKIWTGKNIFENANKNLAGANKQAKALSKTLAGFDEMNVLNGNYNGGSVGVMPSFDLSNTDEMIEKFEKFKKSWFDFGEQMRISIEEMPFSKWTEAFGEWDLAVFGVAETVYGLWGLITTLSNFVQHVSQIIKGIITGDTDEIEDGVNNLFTDIWDWIKFTILTIKGVKDFIEGIIKGIIHTIWGDLFDAIEKGEEKINEFKDKFIGAWTNIRDKVKEKIQELKDWLTRNFGVIGTVIGDVIGGAIKNVVNGIIMFLEWKINTFIGNINSAINYINKIPGVNIKQLSPVSLPKLARGGIVNNPGAGVMMGSYIAGEKGAEAVLPLTDDTLQRLANMMPITVNLTNTMNGRVISRELKKVQNENSFAYNG